MAMNYEVLLARFLIDQFISTYEISPIAVCEALLDTPLAGTHIMEKGYKSILSHDELQQISSLTTMVRGVLSAIDTQSLEGIPNRTLEYINITLFIPAQVLGVCPSIVIRFLQHHELQSRYPSMSRLGFIASASRKRHGVSSWWYQPTLIAWLDSDEAVVSLIAPNETTRALLSEGVSKVAGRRLRIWSERAMTPKQAPPMPDHRVLMYELRRRFQQATDEKSWGQPPAYSDDLHQQS